MNAKALIRFVAVLFIAASLGTLLPTSVSPAVAQTQKFSATVEPSGGLVQVRTAGQQAWQTIDKVTLLHSGDSVRTGDNGAAQLNTVTGIHVDIYPSSQIALRTLALGETDNVLAFQLDQIVGTTYVTIDRALKPQDTVEVTTPAMVAAVRGTKFYVFVSHNGHSVIVGDENIVTVEDINGDTIQNGPDDGTYFELLLNQTPPVVTCTVDFLKKFSTGVTMADLKSEKGKKLFREFLKEFYGSNVSNNSSAFLARLLNLGESSPTQDLFDGIDKFDGSVDTKSFLADLRSLLQDYYSFVSTQPVPPTTCGNGKKDADETAENCASDALDISTTNGNGLCETNKGESLINAPKDCLPFSRVAQACINAIYSNRPTLPGLGGGGGNGGPGPVPTEEATPDGGGTTGGIIPPTPSGVGNTP